MTRFAIQRVRATAAALKLIQELMEDHGPVALLARGEFEEGSPVTCLTRAELLPSDDEIKLGEVGAAPLYVEAREYERWGRPALVVDVAPGSAGSFSLAGLEEIHFVTRTPSNTAVGA